MRNLRRVLVAGIAVGFLTFVPFVSPMTFISARGVKTYGFEFFGHEVEGLPLPVAVLPVLIATLPANLCIATVLLRRRDRRKASRPGLCVKCGYDLTGNKSGVCPECGKAIAA